MFWEQHHICAHAYASMSISCPHALILVTCSSFLALLAEAIVRGVVWAMKRASEFVKFVKHPLVHKAAKGDAAAVKQLESLTNSCELLLNNPSKIQDVCAHVNALVQERDEEKMGEGKWPTLSEFKTFQSVPREWLWQYARNKNEKFTGAWIEKAEGKSNNIIREVFSYACNMDPQQPLPPEAHDPLVFSRCLNTRLRLVC